MKKNTPVKSIIVLLSICIFIAAAMAAINMVTAPKIAAAEKAAKEAALSTVLSENDGFEQLELENLPESVTEVHKDKDGNGVVVVLAAKGYDSSKPISMAVGFDNDGKITALHVISCSGETAGIGDKVGKENFTSQFSGKDSSLDGIDAISGATISSRAVLSSVKDAFVAFEMAKEVEQ